MIENKPVEKKGVNRNIAIVLGVICIVLVLSTAGVFVSQNSQVSQLDVSNAQLKATNTQLELNNTQLTTTNVQLNANNSQLTTVNSQLTSTNAQLNSNVSQLASSNSQLSSQNSQLTTDKSTLQSQVTSLNSQISSLQQNYQAGYSAGNSSGFSVGYIQGLKDGAGTGYDIRNPSYQEMTTFIATDTVHNNVYSSSYTCFNFASDFSTEAFKDGYLCGLVYITFTDGTAHMIDCFKTTNDGLFFIEPQADEIVQLSVGQVYQPSGYEPSGTVNYYAIIW